MADYPNQPRIDDAVKGGQTPPPVDAAILGGLEGVKGRLASAVEEQRIAELSKALKYGKAGLDLVIQALHDESERVEAAAYRLLGERAERKVQQALQEYKHWRLMTCLRTFSCSDKISAIAISPDGKTIVSNNNQEIKVWGVR